MTESYTRFLCKNAKEVKSGGKEGAKLG